MYSLTLILECIVSGLLLLVVSLCCLRFHISNPTSSINLFVKCRLTSDFTGGIRKISAKRSGVKRSSRIF